ncbi:MAG: glycosyltransferase, partial [Massilioclostridium sp.]|nr:glycosyltransferase [Massilioclostridium sp.]
QTVKPQDNIKLLIIGEGPSKEELEQQAAELGIGDQVHFAGKILHDKLPPYYAACDLYITTSLSDTNSISMLEGMAAGLPVLHIRDVLNKGQVVDGVNGYIFQDAQEMYTLLTRYKNMPQQERMELRREARESVKQSGAETLANNLLQVYKVAIETKNAEKVTREV